MTHLFSLYETNSLHIYSSFWYLCHCLYVQISEKVSSSSDSIIEEHSEQLLAQIEWIIVSLSSSFFPSRQVLVPYLRRAFCQKFERSRKSIITREGELLPLSIKLHLSGPLTILELKLFCNNLFINAGSHLDQETIYVETQLSSERDDSVSIIEELWSFHAYVTTQIMGKQLHFYILWRNISWSMYFTWKYVLLWYVFM